MKIVCNRKQLLDALNGVSKAVMTKSTALLALEGILFECDDNNNVTLTATDLEISITTTFAAEQTQQGKIVISAKLLIAMVKKMDGDTVTITSNDKLKVTVKCGIAKFNITGITAEDFSVPKMPDTDDGITIKSSELRDMVGKTIYAVSENTTRPIQTGTKFVIGPDGLTLISVDGYRVALARSENATTPEEKSFVIPAKTLSEVCKLTGKGDEDVTIETAKRVAVFKLGNYTVTTRLLEGDFFDYKKAMPEGHQTRIKVNTDELYSAIERASLIIDDRNKTPIKLSFDNGIVGLTCVTSLGTSYDEAAGDIDGDPVEMGFNSRYLLEALCNCGAEEVYLDINGPTSPVKMLPLEGNEFLSIILPVRLKNA